MKCLNDRNNDWELRNILIKTSTNGYAVRLANQIFSELKEELEEQIERICH